MSTEARAFLGALFGDKPDDLYLLIWTLQDKRSAWFRDVGKAVAYAVAQAAQKDVYVGVALSPADFGPGARCPAAQVAGLVGLWADVDILSPHHKKKNLPPDERAALALLDSLGLAPSIVIHSGHGVHAWWLFKEPWIFESEAEREAGATLAQRWVCTLKAKAAARGWDVDSTFDLARVLRVPGTVNRKGDPVPVRILQQADVRYNPSDFEPYLPEEIPGAGKRVRLPSNGSITLNPKADPPFSKFMALLEGEPKFKQSWERKRKDLQDQSASSYDFALANYAVMAGWTDQEIVDLLIANRRKHGDDLKLRPDYYERTIAKVRDTLRKEEAQELLEEALHQVQKEEAEGGEAPTETPEEAKRRILKSLSELWNVELRRVVKYLSDPPQYRLETARGAIMLGGVEAIISQAQFRAKMAAATGVLIPKCKGKTWETRAQALLNACDEESIGAEATDEGLCRAWVTGYLAERPPNDEWKEALGLNLPFKRDGAVYLVGAGLRKWLKLNQGEVVTPRSMGTILRAGGCEAVVMVYEIEGGKKTTKNVWRVPPHLYE